MSLRLMLQLSLIAALCSPVAALAQRSAPSGPVAPAAAAPLATATQPAGPLQPAAPGAAPPAHSPGLDYRLGPGDKIRILVFGEQELSGEFFVAGSGKVSLPLIGDVQAANLTVGDFQAEVQNALRQGYLKEPRVSAEVLTYRPFFILGEVMKPGEYPYSNGLNVLNAVATAGGFSYRAQKNRVYIRHLNETKEQVYPLTGDLAVAPGDTIRIGERFF